MYRNADDVKLPVFSRIRNQYLIAVLAVLLVSLLCLGTRDLLDYKVTAYVLLVTVSLLAIFLDLLPVLLAAALSALTLDFLFMRPYYTLHVTSPEDGLLLALFFVIALVNGIFTHRVRRLERLARLSEMRQSNMKLYNTILDSLSHELRTPLSTVMGAVEILKDPDGRLGGEGRADLLNEMAQAASRLERQVGNLLSISRVESGYLQVRPDWCDLAEIAYKAIDSVGGKAASHRITVVRNDYLPLFRLDCGLMEHILSNLVSNAVTHTPKGATVRIGIAYVPGVDYENPENIRQPSCIITVSDNGHGFPEGEMANVFRKFHRLSQAAGGTGLGLSIVKGFTEAQGGTVALENREGGGSGVHACVPSPRYAHQTTGP